MQGIGCGIPWAKQGGSAAAAWTPAAVGSTFVVNAPAAFGSRLYQDVAKTSLVTTAGQLVRAWVQEDSLTPDLTQSGATAAPYFTSLSSGLAAMGGDNIDDRIASAQTFSAGAKSIGVRFQYHTVLGSSELDVPLTLGATPSQFRLAIGGPTATFPGVQFICDVAGSSTAFTRFSWTPDTAEHTLLICYNGGSIGSAASYRAWLDGVEQALSSGSSSTASGTTSVGAISVGSAAAGIKIARAFLAPSDLSSSQASVHTWL